MKYNSKIKKELRRIFNKHDIIGIYESEEVNFDEYDPEINLVLKKFKRSMSLKKFTEKVHKIFVEMFSKQIAGPKYKYQTLAKEVYKLLIELDMIYRLVNFKK